MLGATDEFVRGLPYPIARRWYGYDLATDPEKKFFAALTLAEETARYVALVDVATYLARRERGLGKAGIDDELRKLANPSFGHWTTTIRRLQKHLREVGEPPPLGAWLNESRSNPSMSAFLAERGIGRAKDPVSPCAFLDALVPLRNDHKGHGDAPENAAKLGTAILGGVEELLRGVPGMTTRFPVWIRSIRRNDGAYALDVLVFKGTGPATPDTVRRGSHEPLEEDTLVLWDLGDPTTAVRLEPLMVYYKEKLWVYARTKRSGPEYQSAGEPSTHRPSEERRAIEERASFIFADAAIGAEARYAAALAAAHADGVVDSSERNELAEVREQLGLSEGQVAAIHAAHDAGETLSGALVVEGPVSPSAQPPESGSPAWRGVSAAKVSPVSDAPSKRETPAPASPVTVRVSSAHQDGLDSPASSRAEAESASRASAAPPTMSSPAPGSFARRHRGLLRAVLVTAAVLVIVAAAAVFLWAPSFTGISIVEHREGGYRLVVQGKGLRYQADDWYPRWVRALRDRGVSAKESTPNISPDGTTASITVELPRRFDFEVLPLPATFSSRGPATAFVSYRFHLSGVAVSYRNSSDEPVRAFFRQVLEKAKRDPVLAERRVTFDDEPRLPVPSQAELEADDGQHALEVARGADLAYVPPFVFVEMKWATIHAELELHPELAADEDALHPYTCLATKIDADGNDTYTSVVVTSSDGPLAAALDHARRVAPDELPALVEKVPEVDSVTMFYGATSSASSYAIPCLHWNDALLRARAEIVHRGKHDQVFDAVAARAAPGDRRVRLGAVSSDLLGRLDAAKVRALWHSPTIPHGVVVLNDRILPLEREILARAVKALVDEHAASPAVRRFGPDSDIRRFDACDPANLKTFEDGLFASPSARKCVRSLAELHEDSLRRAGGRR